uniref:Uncharacterized protein n=1 Tax=Cannabis sativa TaxID=3483 RepID=A0A803PVU9_CANSA
MLDSRGGAFADELEKSDNFIPTSISKEENPATWARQGFLSIDEIYRIVQELAEPVKVEICNSESTVSAQDYLVHSRQAPDIEVEEMGEDLDVPDCEFEEEGDAEGSETNSVDKTQLTNHFHARI